MALGHSMNPSPLPKKQKLRIGLIFITHNKDNALLLWLVRLIGDLVEQEMEHHEDRRRETNGLIDNIFVIRNPGELT